MVGKKNKANSNSKAAPIDTARQPVSENHGAAESPMQEASPATVDSIKAKEPTATEKLIEAKKTAKSKSAHTAKNTANGQSADTTGAQPDPKKSAKKQEQTAKKAVKDDSEKSVKMKRLTLDISKPLHKAIKAKAVEEGVPMADMLRSLLETHYRQ